MIVAINSKLKTSIDNKPNIKEIKVKKYRYETFYRKIKSSYFEKYSKPIYININKKFTIKKIESNELVKFRFIFTKNENIIYKNYKEALNNCNGIIKNMNSKIEYCNINGYGDIWISVFSKRNKNINFNITVEYEE